MCETNGLDKEDKEFLHEPRFGMFADDFRKASQEMVDYIIHYHSTVENRQTFPDVKPGNVFLDFKL